MSTTAEIQQLVLDSNAWPFQEARRLWEGRLKGMVPAKGYALLQTGYGPSGLPHATLKDWFKALYQILLGQESGPRVGSFIALYGIRETITLLNRAIAGEDLGKP